MPVAALGGRADIMQQLAPLGPVYQAGTLSGNPVAVAAGVATLRAADAAVYAHLDATAATISAAVSDALAAEGVAHAVQRAGNLFSFVFGEDVASGVRDYAGVQRQEAWRYPPFFHAMLDAGVSLPPSVFEAWFVTAAHDDAAIGRIVDALPAAARAAASAEAGSERLRVEGRRSGRLETRRSRAGFRGGVSSRLRVEGPRSGRLETSCSRAGFRDGAARLLNPQNRVSRRRCAPPQPAEGGFETALRASSTRSAAKPLRHCGVATRRATVGSGRMEPWPSFACTTTGSRYTSPRPRRRWRCAPTTSSCSATTSARRPSPTTRGCGSAASASRGTEIPLVVAVGVWKYHGGTDFVIVKGKRQAVVLELAAGEFTRIILSTNHSAALIDRLKIVEPPTDAEAHPAE